MGWVIFGLVIVTVAALLGAAIAASVEDHLGFVVIGFGMGGLAGLIVAMLPISYGQAHYNERVLTCKVEDKDRGGNSDGMRVYTSCGTFQNTDTWWRGKTDSGDLWREIKPGNTQSFTVVGWRFGLLGDFPNILEVKSE